MTQQVNKTETLKRQGRSLTILRGADGRTKKIQKVEDLAKTAERSLDHFSMANGVANTELQLLVLLLLGNRGKYLPRFFVLLENAFRAKTNEQKVREAELWEEIEKAKAKKRQVEAVVTRHAKNKALVRDARPGLEPKHEDRSRDAVARRVGFNW